MSDTAGAGAGRKPDRGYHHGDLRTELIDEVSRLIERDGVDKFSIAEAARNVGVSSGAPYKHFQDRTDLLVHVVASGVDRLREAMAQGRDAQPRGSREAVRGVGLAYLDFATAQPGMFRLIFGSNEQLSQDVRLAEPGERAFGVVIDAVAAYLKIPPTHEVAIRRAHILWRFVHGHSFLTLDKRQPQPTPLPPDAELLDEIGRGILDAPFERGAYETDKIFGPRL
ncbi:MAG: WHG domain-containing protein [Pseudomonadota bacterium]